ncbi:MULTISPECIES: MBL fold metallo-hydrolase [Streptomyces]|uniref:MBL fold metallo-hydrolase n=1 Tax=Streptomyces TaxID=1883 RepID=UPI0015FCB032|nr:MULTISPECIES: MBL fold metallo-hydrolase [unclassified Streptomyces]MCZ2526180.1 MBL fold metallo-hydrolase [Streptomyces sp. HB2AG]
MPVPEVTWWGHATCTVQDSGVRVLTDPLLTGRLAHLRRRGGPVPPADAAREADVALVSHLHSDHLHLPSLAQLAPGTAVLLPRGALRAVPGLRRLPGLGLELFEVAPGDEVRVGPVTVRAVPAEHDGRRLPFGSERAPALGYVVSGEGVTYFAGDTSLFDGMESEIGPCDMALLPVGGWGPFLGPGHLNPHRAAEAARRIAPRRSVPIHYGTFWPVGMGRVRRHEFQDPGRDFVRHAARTAPEVAVDLLLHGESASVDRRRAGR